MKPAGSEIARQSVSFLQKGSTAMLNTLTHSDSLPCSAFRLRVLVNSAGKRFAPQRIVSYTANSAFIFALTVRSRNIYFNNNEKSVGRLHAAPMLIQDELQTFVLSSFWRSHWAFGT